MSGNGSFRFNTNLAFHTLSYCKRQYLSLFLVCLAGMALMLASVFITDGMIAAVNDKSRIYYGGDLAFMGGLWHKTIGDEDGKIEVLKKFVPDGTRFYKRIEYDATEANFIFEGMSVTQRMFKGVDFEQEKDLLSRLNFISGGPNANEERNSVVMSDSVARRLGAKVGDEVVVKTITDDNYINTQNVVVAGVFLDTSLFGMYTSYMDVNVLQKLIDRGDGYINRICMVFPKGEFRTSQLLRMQEGLSQVFNMHPLTDNKRELRLALKEVEEGEGLYGLITLSANIKDLQVVVEAITAVVFLITVVLVLIMAVGMASTYRVIIIKRTVEIGTYRALGMSPKGVRNVFLTEAFWLLMAGFVCGLAVALGISFVLSIFDFSFITAFDMFLVNSHLSPVVKISKFIMLFCVVGVTTILSMLFTIRKVVRMSPVTALSTTT